MKSIENGLKIWTKAGLLWLALALILRLGFFFMLIAGNKIGWSSFLTVLSGYYFDIAVVLFAGAVTLIPLLIINWLLPKATYAVSIVFITLYVILYGCLMGYYSNVMLPLDRVFFVYTPDELYDIVVSSVKFSLWPLVGVIVIMFLYTVFLRFWRKKVNVGKWFSWSYLAVTMLFVIVFNYKSLITNDKGYKSYRDYCLAVNQLAYTANDFTEYWRQNDEDFSLYDDKVLKDAVSLQRLFPDFNYVDIHYPFLRLNDDPDVIGSLLDKTTDGKAPDFVFIIVESLGQRLSSQSPKMSFTPFLDSLKQEGLYWPNCLSLAERTFGVVPNVFSSAPYDKRGFAKVWFPIPDHNSILKDMSKNGYSLSFYYGGNAAFDGQNTYMAGNGVSYIMDPAEADFDQEEKEMMQDNHSWGMYDMDMFNAAIKHRDTVERKRPNTDIYITLSTHEPFYFKGQQEYIKKVDEMLAETTSFGPSEKGLVTDNKAMFATYLYADDCLRQIFEYYRSQPEFENTIFIILGDHRTSWVPVSSSPLLKYNVPLVIYSPLVKEPKTFDAVVTHHDIAPTLTAYLKNNYDYHVDNECHWLGTSLDTASYFRCNQSVAFMLNSRDEVEYLHHGYMLDRDRLFVVNDSLILDEIRNDSIKDQLAEYLRIYKNVDWYVTQNDFLIRKPENLKELMNYVDMDDVKYHVEKETEQALCEKIKFNRNWERLYVDVKFNYKNLNGLNPQKFYILFKINNKQGQSILYKSFKFFEMSIKTEEGNLLRAKTTFFVVDKEIKDLSMKIGIYTEQDLDIECNDVRIKVEGF